MQKIKEFLKSGEFRKVSCLCAVMACMCISCFAADEATMQTAFTTGFTQIVTDAKSMIAAIVPIAVGLAGTIFIVRKAMGWFKSLAK